MTNHRTERSALPQDSSNVGLGHFHRPRRYLFTAEDISSRSPHLSVVQPRTEHTKRTASVFREIWRNLQTLKVSRHAQAIRKQIPLEFCPLPSEGEKPSQTAGLSIGFADSNLGAYTRHLLINTPVECDLYHSKTNSKRLACAKGTAGIASMRRRTRVLSLAGRVSRRAHVA